MASNNFIPCLKITLREEGGFSNNSHDPGGRTMRGVTQRSYDDWRRKNGRPRADVKNIAERELQAIYMTYWRAVAAEELTAGIDLSVFDLGVNSGPATARKILERSIDGTASKSINNIAINRLRYLQSLKTWETFKHGWEARVARIRLASLGMLDAATAQARADNDGR